MQQTFRKLDGHRASAIAEAKRSNAYQGHKKMLGPAIGTMMKKLQNAIMDRERRSWHGGYDSGRLDSRRLTAAYLGSTTVYKQREEAEGLNTCATILVDLSSSMNGRSIAMAQLGCIALAEALEGTGVSLEILGFAESDWSEAGHNPPNMPNGQKFGRINPVRMVVFKDFDQSLRTAEPMVGAMPNFVCGGTNDTEGILKAYRRLAVRPQRRKIMMVLSDGQPGYYSHYGNGFCQQSLRDAVHHVSARGVQMIGIGILTDSVKQYYPVSTVLKDINDLTGEMVNELAKGLLGINLKSDHRLIAKAGTVR